jgi:hypothetical protein
MVTDDLAQNTKPGEGFQTELDVKLDAVLYSEHIKDGFWLLKGMVLLRVLVKSGAGQEKKDLIQNSVATIAGYKIIRQGEITCGFWSNKELRLVRTSSFSDKKLCG